MKVFTTLEDSNVSNRDLRRDARGTARAKEQNAAAAQKPVPDSESASTTPHPESEKNTLCQPQRKLKQVVQSARADTSGASALEKALIRSGRKSPKDVREAPAGQISSAAQDAESSHAETRGWEKRRPVQLPSSTGRAIGALLAAGLAVVSPSSTMRVENAGVAIPSALCLGDGRAGADEEGVNAKPTSSRGCPSTSTSSSNSSPDLPADSVPVRQSHDENDQTSMAATDTRPKSDGTGYHRGDSVLSSKSTTVEHRRAAGNDINAEKDYDNAMMNASDNDLHPPPSQLNSEVSIRRWLPLNVCIPILDAFPPKGGENESGTHNCRPSPMSSDTDTAGSLTATPARAALASDSAGGSKIRTVTPQPGHASLSQDGEDEGNTPVILSGSVSVCDKNVDTGVARGCAAGGFPGADQCDTAKDSVVDIPSKERSQTGGIALSPAPPPLPHATPDPAKKPGDNNSNAETKFRTVAANKDLAATNTVVTGRGGNRGGGGDNGVTSDTKEEIKTEPMVNVLYAPSGEIVYRLRRGVSRSGKWSRLEEEYAKRIIIEFDAGLLDEEPGTGLRQLLAYKLNCEGMRVSKKFCGEASVGKRAFRPALVDNGESRGAQARLFNLEQQWLETLAPFAGGPTHNPYHNSTSAFTSTATSPHPSSFSSSYPSSSSRSQTFSRLLPTSMPERQQHQSQPLLLPPMSVPINARERHGSGQHLRQVAPMYLGSPPVDADNRVGGGGGDSSSSGANRDVLPTLRNVLAGQPMTQHSDDHVGRRLDSRRPSRTEGGWPHVQVPHRAAGGANNSRLAVEGSSSSLSRQQDENSLTRYAYFKDGRGAVADHHGDEEEQQPNRRSEPSYPIFSPHQSYDRSGAIVFPDRGERGLGRGHGDAGGRSGVGPENAERKRRLDLDVVRYSHDRESDPYHQMPSRCQRPETVTSGGGQEGKGMSVRGGYRGEEQEGSGGNWNNDRDDSVRERYSARSQVSPGGRGSSSCSGAAGLGAPSFYTEDVAPSSSRRPSQRPHEDYHDLSDVGHNDQREHQHAYNHRHNAVHDRHYVSDTRSSTPTSSSGSSSARSDRSSRFDSSGSSSPINITISRSPSSNSNSSSSSSSSSSSRSDATMATLHGGSAHDDRLPRPWPRVGPFRLPSPRPAARPGFAHCGIFSSGNAGDDGGDRFAAKAGRHEDNSSSRCDNKYHHPESLPTREIQPATSSSCSTTITDRVVPRLALLGCELATKIEPREKCGHNRYDYYARENVCRADKAPREVLLRPLKIRRFH